MRHVTAEELRTALTLAARRPPARQALAHLVRAVPVPRITESMTAWSEQSGGADAADSTWALAELLAGEAVNRPEFAGELRRWHAEVLAAEEPAEEAPAAEQPADSPGRTAARPQVANSIGTSARVVGPVVQARDITGGVHIHPVLDPTAARAPAVPRQVPPLPGHFVNRRAEQAALDRLVGSSPGGSTIAVVSGPAGIGKTALARHWLLGRTDSFPDGQLYADLRGHSADGPARPGELLTELLRSFGHERVPAELNEQAALWRSVTADARIALLLDNALSAAQVRPLLPGSTVAFTLVTSRNRLTGLGLEGASFVSLDVLPTGDAMELLSRRVGADRVRREPEAALVMAEACAGLPLAVCVAGARAASRPRQSLEVLARALSGNEGEGPLEALRMGGESAVRAALQESYRLLGTQLARSYRYLSLAPVPVLTPAVAAALCDVDGDAVDRLLDELVEVHLLEDLGPDPRTGLDRYRFHDLIRAHARERAADEETTEDTDRAVRRVVDFHLAAATAAEALLSPSHRTLRRDYAGQTAAPPFTDAPGALRWLDAERARLMAVLRTAVARGWDATAWQLADALWPLFLRLRPYDLWIEAHEMGLAAARRIQDRAGISRMLTSGGAGLRNVGRYEEALTWFGQALDVAREDVTALEAQVADRSTELTAARRNEAQALHGLGQTHRLAGQLDLAREYFTRDLALREQIGYRRGAAVTRLCLGDTALADDRPAEALGHLARARAELLAEDDPYDAARALAFLGRAHARLDDTRHDLAERQLRQAITEFEATGSVHWQARVLEMLGEAAEDRGDLDRARHWYEQSLTRYEPVSEADVRRVGERLRRVR
ncbi:tetratricopeptide repeat protein [Streptomyces sp. NPDC047042]|uniref:ATP-binding protein n=1 Tax=Streptomyces sp. NPDC047042 TaxID=3154807 RepID=UPI0033C70ECE